MTLKNILQNHPATRHTNQIHVALQNYSNISEQSIISKSPAYWTVPVFATNKYGEVKQEYIKQNGLYNWSQEQSYLYVSWPICVFLTNILALNTFNIPNDAYLAKSEFSSFSYRKYEMFFKIFIYIYTQYRALYQFGSLE